MALPLPGAPLRTAALPRSATPKRVPRPGPRRLATRSAATQAIRQTPERPWQRGHRGESVTPAPQPLSPRLVTCRREGRGRGATGGPLFPGGTVLRADRGRAGGGSAGPAPAPLLPFPACPSLPALPSSSLPSSLPALSLGGRREPCTAAAGRRRPGGGSGDGGAGRAAAGAAPVPLGPGGGAGRGGRVLRHRHGRRRALVLAAGHGRGKRQLRDAAQLDRHDPLQLLQRHVRGPREKSQDCMYLQYCKVCQSYKAPRSHHCRKCNRCVMKMDHHCPWINNCCGYQNHASFTLFLLLAPLGCIHASFIFIMTMYTQLYNRISFGWSSVKIDMSAAKRDPRPIIPFGLSAFAASLFALGLALGTTIAVGMLFIIQMKVILTNKTSIESWIEEKAKDRIQYYQTGETFIFPYDMGSKWKNFRQVFTWSGIPEGDGLDWPVRDGCHQYSLTIEQLKQKADKRVRSVRYRAIEDYSGVCCPVTKGVKTFFTTPCTEEPRIALSKGDLILATRGLKHWMYGEKILISAADGGIRERGWFPRKCVEKYQYDSETDQPVDGEKKSK
ncbi:palmitoyltransferase ZDHHC6 isoform X2 [Passer domesticus]|uniref:palmitoyltransferase ZDHHC6 isoform X2 n=1 Tax=Passer domesticus TaxID=48849 RepID=UPI0030FED7B1